jgi:hypothetical protein
MNSVWIPFDGKFFRDQMTPEIKRLRRHREA